MDQSIISGIVKIEREIGAKAPIKSYVYYHIKSDTKDVFYVGKGKKGRCISSHYRSNYWKNVASKHGVTVRIVKDNLSDACALTLEKILISSLRTQGVCLVNLTDGGEGASGMKMTYDQVERNRLAQKGLQSGEKNPMFGKKHSPESIAKIRAARLGYIASKDTRLLQSKSKLGIKRGPMSPEQKAKLSVSKCGRLRDCDHPLYDHRLFEFSHVDGRVHISTQKQFSDIFSLSRSNICAMVKNMKGSVKGWTVIRLVE